MAGPDFTPFFAKIATGSIVLAVVSIAGACAVMLVARTGAGQVLRMLSGKVRATENEKRHRQRYAREQKNREYRAWKKRKGY